jgi:hypothetical protein
MALGLGSLGKKSKKAESDKPAKDAKKSSTQNEAADILKKMDEKAAAGACPFC